MKKKLQNKAFLGVLVVLIYQVLEKYHVAPSLDEYQVWVDVVSYLILGFGVYNTFDGKDGEQK